MIALAKRRSLLLLPVLLYPGIGWGHGSYHDVLTILNGEIAQAPDNTELILQRAKLHLSHETWVEAMADLERVDRLKPTDHLTDGLRGQALNQAGQWAPALEALNARLEAAPEDTEAFLERARARFHLGDSGSTEDFRMALAATEVTTPERVLEAVDAIEQFEDRASASEFLEKIMNGHPVEPSLWERAIELDLELGEFDAALEHLEQLSPVAPRPEPGIARRARILERAGRREEALATWTGLRDRLMALPNLERGSPLLSQLLAEAQKALGMTIPAPVVAQPAP